jgi:hypothetical protein
MTGDFDTEWDDGCPGLVEMLAREAEWKARELSNDVVQWGFQEQMVGRLPLLLVRLKRLGLASL